MASRKRTNFITQLLYRLVSYIKRPKVGQPGWWWDEREPMCSNKPPIRATVVSTNGGGLLIDLGESYGLTEADPNDFKTTPYELVDRRNKMLEEKSYFGLCPICLEINGYINIGSDHWFYCRKHGTKWFFGSNVFSSWKDETKKEQKGKFNELNFGSYKEVKPYRSLKPLQQAAMRLGFSSSRMSPSDLLF